MTECLKSKIDVHLTALTRLGYDVTLTPRDKIKPCPLCECTAISLVKINVMFNNGMQHPYQRYQCDNCGITTEGCLYHEDAVLFWNELPRRKNDI